MARFQKGVSGNPRGKAPGTRNKATVLVIKLMESGAKEITEAVIAAARNGDMAAVWTSHFRRCFDHGNGTGLSNLVTVPPSIPKIAHQRRVCLIHRKFRLPLGRCLVRKNRVIADYVAWFKGVT